MLSTFSIMEHAWLIYRAHFKKLTVLALPLVALEMAPPLSNPETYIRELQTNPLSSQVVWHSIALIVQLLLISLCTALLIYQIDRHLRDTASTMKSALFHVVNISRKIIGITILVGCIMALSALPYTATVWYFALQLRNVPPLAAALYALPLLVPVIYVSVIFLPAGFIVVLDNVNILEALNKSRMLLKGRFLPAFVRVLGPQIGWTLIEFLITFILFLLGFLGSIALMKIMGTVPHVISTAMIAVGIAVAVAVQLIFVPLTTGSMVVWYRELTKE